MDFFPKLVSKVKGYADEVCSGRYVIIIMGGASVKTANYIIPRMVKVLLEGVV